MQLFNFHTHNPKEEFGIINSKLNSTLESNKRYSFGIHPWDYNDNWEDSFIQVKRKANNKSVVAIGETGFDPKSQISIEKQKSIFGKHVELSEILEKPLIIHCVKYFNELVQIKKSLKPQQTWIIHGFRGKISVAEQLFKNDFYFSINEDLINDTSKAQQLLKLIGSNRLFLETDDHDGDIKNIYNFAAKFFNIEIEKLVDIIDKNLSKCKIQSGRKEQSSF